MWRMTYTIKLFEAVEILFITIIRARCCLSCLGEKGTGPVQKESGLCGMYVSYVRACAIRRVKECITGSGSDYLSQ